MLVYWYIYIYTCTIHLLCNIYIYIHIELYISIYDDYIQIWVGQPSPQFSHPAARCSQLTNTAYSQLVKARREPVGS